MGAAVQARGLGKQYRRTWALRGCTLAIPEGRVVGLVGPNGAGKTTLLQLAAGLLAPTCGTIAVLGTDPAAGPAQLARVGFVAQDTPVYARMPVADHLRLGAWLNPGWDHELARRRVAQVGLDLRQRARFLLLVPAIIGTFWAAPLLTREFEAGTFQFVWTQSVTRTRWLAARLGTGALAAMATAGLFSLLLTWWSGPIDTAAPFAKRNSVTFLRLGFVLFPPAASPPSATPRSPSRWASRPGC